MSYLHRHNVQSLSVTCYVLQPSAFCKIWSTPAVDNDYRTMFLQGQGFTRDRVELCNLISLRDKRGCWRRLDSFQDSKRLDAGSCMILGLLFFEGKLCCPFSFRLCQTAKLEAWTQVEGQTITQRRR